MNFFTIHRRQIIQLFKLIYYSLLVLGGFGFWAISTEQNYQLTIFDIGLWLGRASVVAFSLVLLPGIAQRFGIHSPFFNILRLFRRHIGILTYLLVIVHSTFVFTAVTIRTGAIPANLPLFVYFGLIASWLLLPLFLTSNDTSVRWLGPWWGRLHKLVYVIAWLAFFHTVLQRWSAWSILIGFTAGLETLSLLYKYIIARRSQSNVNLNYGHNQRN